MSFFWVFIYTLLFSLLLVSCDSIVDVTAGSFIVRVQSDLKPQEYSDAEDWYRSIIESLNASKNSNISYHARNTNYFIHFYDTIFHGFSVKLTTLQAEELNARPEILAVFPDRVRQTQTTRTPGFLGLDETSGQNGILNESDWGSNAIVGVLDTGVWPESHSFYDGYLKPIPPRWKGKCDGGEEFPKTLCNKKLIGARYFTRGYVSRFGAAENYTRSARDSVGHGTHTASTAAGRRVGKASLLGYARGTSSGIAPKARIAVYKVCAFRGCLESDILAGMDCAAKDGVDVVSLSLGAFPERYSTDPIAICSYAAMEKGIVVSASAGNMIPPDGSVTNIAPWITTVGAGTLDRTFPADLTLEDGNVITGSSLYSGKHPLETEFFPLMYARSAAKENQSKGDAAYCLPNTLDGNLVSGKIVVCDLGMISASGQAVVVSESGGAAVVSANVEPFGEGLLAYPYLTPGLSITESARAALLEYIASSKNPRASIRFRGTLLGANPAPMVGFFSCRGPNSISRYVLKPDVIAPGVNILASWPDNLPPSSVSGDERRTKFNIISGTSMSCPHVSGLAALLKGAHQDWSPAMIKSAMMTTAYTRDRDGNALLDELRYTAATVWDFGAGHVDPEKAVDPGLVYDLTPENYIDFLCASNYSSKEIKAITGREVACPVESETPLNAAWELNYPAISVVFGGSNSTREISVTRTVTHVREGASTYVAKITSPGHAIVSVDPDVMAFTEKGEKGTFVVKILGDEAGSSSGTDSGMLTWTDGKHEVNSAVVVNWEIA